LNFFFSFALHSCAKAVMTRCEKEQTEFFVKPADRKGVKVLVTEKALKDSQIIMPASCLVFSSKALARDFLNQGGNAALMSAPLIEVQNLEVPDDNFDCSVRSVWCVQTGISQLIGHHKHTGSKVPNVEFVCNPSKGPNDGFLSIKVSTHNLCGVATQSVLSADFGNSYEVMEVASPAAKQFRGGLDLFFTRATRKEEDPEVRAHASSCHHCITIIVLHYL
jgi:hypothetical protein